MANLVVLQTSLPCAGLRSSSQFSPLHHRFQDCSPPFQTQLPIRKERGVAKAHYSDSTSGSPGIQFWRSASSSLFPVPKAVGGFSDSVEDSASSASNAEWENEDENTFKLAMWNTSSEVQEEGIVLSSGTGTKLQRLTQDAAMGLVLREGLGTGWTTGSGLEGPTGDIENESKEEPKFPNLSKSPRRKMRVAFTCNVCGERTIRAINPLAYTDGTVFVQVHKEETGPLERKEFCFSKCCAVKRFQDADHCKGCDVFHKLVDNLNLFHEMRGKIYRGYDIPWYANDQPYNFYDGQFYDPL